MAKLGVGVMLCQCCAKEVVVKENENKTLSYCCQWCDDAPYQKAGTLAYQAWRNKIIYFESEPPAKVPEKTPPIEAKPDAKKGAGTLLG